MLENTEQEERQEMGWTGGVKNRDRKRGWMKWKDVRMCKTNEIDIITHY